MTTRTPRGLRAALLLTTVSVAAACGGGGGGGGGPPADMAGYWLFYMTPTGGPGEVGPSPVFLSQAGNVIDGAAISGTVNGNHFAVTSAPGPFTLALNGSVNGTNASGNMTVTGGINASGTFRMVRVTPTGTMSATGTVSGLAVSMSSNAALGSRDYSDQSLTTLSAVEVAMAYGSEHLELEFTPAGLAVGALSVPGTVAVTVEYRNDTGSFEVDATAGTVTVTRYDGTGFAGSFTLTLPGAATLTGSFDVSWDISSYDP